MIRACGAIAVCALAGIAVAAGIVWAALYFGQPTILPL